MRGAAWLAMVLLVGLPCSIARAGNDDGVLLGNEAAMTGGAVVATVGDGSGVWYNPAGIARVRRATVDVNGSAFSLRIGVTPGLLSSSTGTTADGGYLELVSIPSALTLVRDLGAGVHGAIGVFVPRFSDHADIVSLDESVVGGLARWQMTQAESYSQYHAGLSLGFRIGEHFRLGLTLFAVYRSTAINATFGGGVTLDDGTVFASLATSTRVALEALGAELVGGLQWNPIDALHIGLSVVSPGVNFAARYRVVELGVGGSPAGLGFSASDVGVLAPQLGLISPARVRLGIAYAFTGGWISLEGDVQHPLSQPDFGIDRRLVLAARLGTRFRVDDEIALGFGLFTDMSPDPLPTRFGATQIDFFGGTAGLVINNEHQLGEGEGASTMRFSTTIAARYAVGIGTVGGLRFDTAASDTETVVLSPVDTTVHEMSLHIGSALYF